MANNFPNNVSFWSGGSNNWFTVADPSNNVSGWVLNGTTAIPDAGTDAGILEQNITATISGGDAVSQSLSMQGGSTGLSATSAVIGLSGGSPTLYRGSPV